MLGQLACFNRAHPRRASARLMKKMAMIDKLTCLCWILVLSSSCREVQARGRLPLGHETSLQNSEREALSNEHLYEQIVDLRSRPDSI